MKPCVCSATESLSGTVQERMPARGSLRHQGNYSAVTNKGPEWLLTTQALWRLPLTSASQPEPPAQFPTTTSGVTDVGAATLRSTSRLRRAVHSSSHIESCSCCEYPRADWHPARSSPPVCPARSSPDPAPCRWHAHR